MQHKFYFYYFQQDILTHRFYFVLDFPPFVLKKNGTLRLVHVIVIEAVCLVDPV